MFSVENAFESTIIKRNKILELFFFFLYLWLYLSLFIESDLVETSHFSILAECLSAITKPHMKLDSLVSFY